MRSMFIPSPDLIAALREALADVTDFTDLQCEVRLVEGEFDPADPTTWPAASTHFAAQQSLAAPTIEYDAVSEKWFLFWQDPEGGWDFVSATITGDITVSGYTVKVVGDVNDLGATKVEPVTITGNGQHINLPFVCAEIPDDLLVPADQPIVL